MFGRLIWGFFFGAISHKIREKKIIVSQCKSLFSQQELATLAREKFANPPLPPQPSKKKGTSWELLNFQDYVLCFNSIYCCNHGNTDSLIEHI